MLSRRRRSALLGAGSSDGFTPGDIVILDGWYKGDDTSTIVQSGGDVSQWSDKSGNDAHATQTNGTNKPRTGDDTINSKNIISYSVDDFLNISGIARSGDLDVMFVAKVTTTGRTIQYFYTPDGSNDGHFCDFNYGEDGSEGIAYTGGYIKGSVLTQDQPYILSYTQKSGTGYLYENGVLKNSTSSYSLEMTSGMEIGRNGYPHYFYGGIGEFVVGKFTDEERNNLGAYLSSEWGVTWNDIT